jgi:hypothetical protein
MRIIKEERGVALATALGILVVLSVMSASVFAVSTRVNDTSTSSRDAKRALAAADSGLEAAVFRMNKLGLQATSKCFTTEAVATATGTDPETGSTPAAGECAGLNESIGNGSTYTYYVTPELEEDDICAGLPVHYIDSDGRKTVTQRCVTSIGRSGNERRRIQARVASYIGTQLFPVGGILAINGLTVNNTAIVSGVLGSNGQITLGNSSVVSGGIELGEADSPQPILGNGTTLGGPVTHRSATDGAFVLAPVDMGNTATENDNSRITSGNDAGSNVTYDPATRSLTIGNNGSLTLGGGAYNGTYNFCKVVMGNNSFLTIAVGAKVRLFLDSPDRTGSGCIPSGMNAITAKAAGWGGMVLNQGSNFNNPGNAINFQIYMYGYSDGSHTVEFNNTSAMNAAIYAPNSNLIWKNTAGITGGVSASTVEFKNSASFAWSGDSGGFSLQDLRTDTVSVYYRMAWTECRRQRTATTDPESGC